MSIGLGLLAGEEAPVRPLFPPSVRPRTPHLFDSPPPTDRPSARPSLPPLFRRRPLICLSWSFVAASAAAAAATGTPFVRIGTKSWGGIPSRWGLHGNTSGDGRTGTGAKKGEGKERRGRRSTGMFMCAVCEIFNVRFVSTLFAIKITIAIFSRMVLNDAKIMN